MNLSINIISLIVVAVVLVATVIVAIVIGSKANKKSSVRKTYDISDEKYTKFQKKSKEALSNTTLTFSSKDPAFDLEIDRGFAGYEKVVRKGVELLKADGFKIPSLGVIDDA